MTDQPNDFWPDFEGNHKLVKIECAGEGSLAVRVLEAYGIPLANVKGGDLPDLDIKHMDALQVMKMSLLQESSDVGEIYEPVMSSTGEVEFKAVGHGTGPSDIYYEIQSSTYKEECSGIMVVGKDPIAERIEVEWKDVWSERPVPFDAGFMYSSCTKPSFNQYSVLVYNDPHLDSQYEDGITNLYEITASNPWESITGYAYFLAWNGWEDDKDTVVTRMDTAKIIIPLPDNKMGDLQDRPGPDISWGEDPACYDGTGVEVDPKDGIKVPLPEEFRHATVRNTKVDKFSGIVGVYVVGWFISNLRGQPKTDANAANIEPTNDDADIYVSIKETYQEVFKLDEGTQYVVAYEEGELDPYIVFANNLRVGDPAKIDGNNETRFKIDKTCDYYALNQYREDGVGYILPSGPSTGILVKQIFVGVELETPSILIYNPKGSENKAHDIAESIVYKLAPIVTNDEPPPIAFNGSIIDQIGAIQDHDPTTTQNFEDTELELALAEMNAGGGMSLTLSFLDENQCQKLSSALFDHMNSGDGVETTYICGPNCDAELGGLGPSGGIVNSITYSYQDSSSYTISVNCGPVLVGGMSSVQGGPAPKVVETFSAKGTVVQDKGNNAHFKVRVDGFGDCWAINMCPAVVRVGDKVNVSVHNNPVEA